MARASLPEKPRRGRPPGSFTQRRRFDKLRELLQKHPRGMTLYEMAEALKVTPRTMRRYLKEVERECDLESEEVRGGGQRRWRVAAGELTRKVALRRTQAYALLAARRVFEPLRGTTLYDEIDMAVSRLADFAERPGRGPNAGLADSRLSERFLYLPHAPKDYEGHTEVIDDLFQAVSDLRPMTLSYRSRSRGSHERFLFHPYALVLHRDAIYCVGLHADSGEIRTLAVDRMTNTDVSFAERFELPADFSVDDYFQGELGIWKGGEPQKVVVEFDARAEDLIRVRKVHGTQKLAGIGGGGVRLTMTVGNLNPVVSWVLEWGPRARVVEPPELVERVKAELAEALHQYDSAPKRSRKKAG